jgi:hypothetical protein
MVKVMQSAITCLICLLGLLGVQSLKANHVECEVGKLVFDYSNYLLDNVMTSVKERLPKIFDALNLERCNQTRPVLSFSTRLSASEEILRTSLSRKRIYVDPEQGNDAGHGDVKRPLRSLKAALLASRKKMEPAIIILRGGRYELDETIVLDSRDNGISILNYPREEPVLSGGRVLNLDWKPWSCQALAKHSREVRAGTASCWSASTASADLSSIDFNQLFFHERRAIRARHPNAGSRHFVLLCSTDLRSCLAIAFDCWYLTMVQHRPRQVDSRFLLS